MSAIPAIPVIPADRSIREDLAQRLERLLLGTREPWRCSPVHSRAGRPARLGRWAHGRPGVAQDDQAASPVDSTVRLAVAEALHGEGLVMVENPAEETAGDAGCGAGAAECRRGRAVRRAADWPRYHRGRRAGGLASHPSPAGSKHARQTSRCVPDAPDLAGFDHVPRLIGATGRNRTAGSLRCGSGSGVTDTGTGRYSWSDGAYDNPTTAPSGERSRATVWPHGSSRASCRSR